MERRAGFDDPSMLRGSPTSFMEPDRSKHIFQYMCEHGHNIMRNPVPLVEGLKHYNVFKLGFAMARNYPGQMSAYLALGALYLSHTSPSFKNDAQKHYATAVHSMRNALAQDVHAAPPEWACATAAILSVFEVSADPALFVLPGVGRLSSEYNIKMYRFVDPTVHKAHFLGFHRMMQIRLRLDPYSWGPSRMVVEIYIYCLAKGCTFFREMMSGKTINYIDELIALLNEVPRPLGPEICGVPSIFLSIAYKLAFLTEKPLGEEPWTFELICIDKKLTNWEPDLHLLAYPSREKLLIARLYHLACSVWTRKLLHPGQDSNILFYWNCVSHAVKLFEKNPLAKNPPTCIGWPLAMLNMAAMDPYHRQVLRSPVETLINDSNMRGFQSLIVFLDQIWGQGPGSSTYLGMDAVFRPDLLQDAHI